MYLYNMNRYTYIVWMNCIIIIFKSSCIKEDAESLSLGKLEILNKTSHIKLV
jgi:hypothetical protein